MCHDVVVFKPHNERSRPPRRLPPSVWVSQNTGSKSTASMPFGCCSTGTQPRRATAIQPASAPRGAASGHRAGQHHHPAPGDTRPAVLTADHWFHPGFACPPLWRPHKAPGQPPGFARHGSEKHPFSSRHYNLHSLDLTGRSIRHVKSRPSNAPAFRIGPFAILTGDPHGGSRASLLSEVGRVRRPSWYP